MSCGKPCLSRPHSLAVRFTIHSPCEANALDLSFSTLNKIHPE